MTTESTIVLKYTLRASLLVQIAGNRLYYDYVMARARGEKVMTRRNYLILITSLTLALTLSAGCNNRLESYIKGLNQSATEVAGGSGIVGTPLAMLTPAPTKPPNLYDLTVTNDTLVHAWGQTYGLPSGSEFTIYATQLQLTEFIIQTLQIGGWQDTVKGGNVTIGTGQLRLDVAIQDTAGDTGAGTVTFQPTIDELGRLKLNPQGAQFGQLQIPDGLTAALGDAVEQALIGAKNNTLSKVTLKTLSLENETLRVTGRLR
jgi:hypothetical protein